MVGTDPVVTLFETYGAGADSIGPALAGRLGVPFVGQRYSSEELAERDAQARRGFFERLRGGFGFGGAMGAPDTSLADDVRANCREVLEAAASGVVILGRNATAILRQDPRAFHVKLDAPPDDRLARASATHGIDRAEASRRQAREDHMRAEMSVETFNWDPRHADAFDLVVNTGRLTDAQVIDLICAAYEVAKRHG